MGDDQRERQAQERAELQTAIAEALRAHRFALALKLLDLFDERWRARRQRAWSRGVRDAVARALIAGTPDADRPPPPRR